MKTIKLAVFSMAILASGLVCANSQTLTGNLGKSVFDFAANNIKGFSVVIPEPSTLALGALSGLVMLVAARRRK